MLRDGDRAIVMNTDDDASARYPKRLRKRSRSGEGDQQRGKSRDRERSPQKLTSGADRASVSTSKYSRAANPKIPATKFDGTVCTALLYDNVVSL